MKQEKLNIGGRMTKTLTEKWKEDTLDNGLYYWNIDGCNMPSVSRTYDMRKLKKRKYADKIEVIAPVPSYDEYNELVQKMHIREKKLEIATKALEYFKKEEDNYLDFGLTSSWKEVKLKPNRVATKALKEMEGVK